MKQIVFQQQTLKKNCASACISMILGRPIEEVTGEFHERYMADEITVHEYLEKYGVQAAPMDITDKPTQGFVYFIGVPSLNIKGCSHYVLGDFRNKEDGFVLIDPNKGRKGKEWYVNYSEGAELSTGEFNVITCNYDYRLTLPA